jgi:hypothetical protein
MRWEEAESVRWVGRRWLYVQDELLRSISLLSRSAGKSRSALSGRGYTLRVSPEMPPFVSAAVKA